MRFNLRVERPTHHGGTTSSHFYGVRWKEYRHLTFSKAVMFLLETSVI